MQKAKSDMDPQSSDRYRLEFLRFGFVVNGPKAKSYLRELLRQPAEIMTARHSSHSSDRFKETLCTIVEEITLARGHRQVGISLSAGLDSRALLGALLEIYQPKDIHALTYGAPSHADRIGAERLQRKVGFSHTVVDFDDYAWRAEDLEERVRRQYEISGRLDSIGSVQTYAVRSRCLGELPILQGYLGDALSMPQHRSSAFMFEKGAAPELFRRDIEEFLATNDVMGRRSPTADGMSEIIDDARSKLTSYMQECATFLERFPGLSSYDLVNLGFRQGLRIRPDTDFMPSTLLPFEHPAWVDYWLNQPLVHRSDKSHYRRCLLGSFPHVFQDLSMGPFRSRASQMGVVGKKILSRLGIAVSQNKGDPRKNDQLRQLMLSLSRSFDSRGLVRYEVQSELERWLRRADRSAASRVKWAVSLELHIRAGNL